VRRKHQDLLAWQQAVELVKLVYRITSAFPQHETYGLTGQMRRAAISVPANLGDSQEARALIDRLFGLIDGLINSERRASAP
jgi:four helix bundle protein